MNYARAAFFRLDLEMLTWNFNENVALRWQCDPADSINKLSNSFSESWEWKGAEIWKKNGRFVFIMKSMALNVDCMKLNWELKNIRCASRTYLLHFCMIYPRPTANLSKALTCSKEIARAHYLCNKAPAIAWQAREREQKRERDRATTERRQRQRHTETVRTQTDQNKREFKGIRFYSFDFCWFFVFLFHKNKHVLCYFVGCC